MMLWWWWWRGCYLIFFLGLNTESKSKHENCTHLYQLRIRRSRISCMHWYVIPSHDQSSWWRLVSVFDFLVIFDIEQFVNFVCCQNPIKSNKYAIDMSHHMYGICHAIYNNKRWNNFMSWRDYENANDTLKMQNNKSVDCLSNCAKWSS